MLPPILENRLEDLLAAWRHHDELRRRRAGLAELAAARWRLEAHRHDTHRLRRGFLPEGRELEDALGTTYCDSFGETVFLYAADADWSSKGRFRCVCGADVQMETR